MAGKALKLLLIGLAGVAGSAVALKSLASGRHGRGASGVAQQPPSETPDQQATIEPEAKKSDKPLLSPRWFVLSHFSMLAILLGIMVVGLAIRGIRRYPPDVKWPMSGADAGRGRALIATYGCGGCHVIPGADNANGKVGPSLEGFAERMFIGGQLANTPENLIAWLQNPQRYAPGTAMPNQAISEQAARDMAAFLYGQ